ncbi:unnamed protein product [Paramecium sonneborni]|uniref:Uncharacterized protein n=1 Tax=Paramecium sonneborni TaxID=65129 RepID=A0A8S1Q263_9CILI|nr:unnamed protein product [Paramecium sonneborni]
MQLISQQANTFYDGWVINGIMKKFYGLIKDIFRGIQIVPQQIMVQKYYGFVQTNWQNKVKQKKITLEKYILTKQLWVDYEIFRGLHQHARVKEIIYLALEQFFIAFSYFQNV